MSEQTQVKEEFYTYNGSNYHKDYVGKWWVGSNGYENIYINAIEWDPLRQHVAELIERQELQDKKRIEFNNETYTFFMDKAGDVYNSKLSRKVKVPEESSTGEKIEVPEQIKKMAEDNAKKSTGGFNKGESGWFSYDSYQLVTLKEYYDKRQTNKMIRPLRPKEMTPTCFYVKDEHGNETVKIWIGEWMKPQQ